MDLKFKYMKKLITTAAIAILFSVTAFAADGGRKDEKGGTIISYNVLNQFNASFKNAKNATWTVSSNCQKVNFILDGAQVTAFYDMSGEYMGATQDVDFKVVPFYAQEDITAAYSDYRVKEVIKFQYDVTSTNAYAPTYFVDLKKADSEIILKVVNGEKPVLYKTVK